MMAWHSWQKCETCGGYRPTSYGGLLAPPSTSALQRQLVGEDPPGALCKCPSEHSKVLPPASANSGD